MKIQYNIDEFGNLSNIYLEIIDDNDILDNTINIIIPKIINGNKVCSLGSKPNSRFFIGGSPEVYSKLSSLPERICLNFSLPNSITTINNFNINQKISDVCKIDIKIPKTVEIIGDNAFREICFKSFSFEEDSNIVSFPFGAFKKSCFDEIFIFPKSCTIINNNCFQGAVFNKGIDFDNSNLEFIHEYAFEEAVLNTPIINFPDSLEFLGSFSFQLSKNINKICFSNNSNFSIMKCGAFYSCSSLKSVIIRSRKKYVNFEEFCFEGCINLEELDLSEISSEVIPKSFCKNSSRSYLKTFKLPKNVKIIGEKAFYHTLIKKVFFPKTVVSIHSQCFYSSKLVEIEFENIFNLKVLDSFAFSNCNLRTIPSNILTNLEICGDNVFSGNLFVDLKLEAPSSTISNTSGFEPQKLFEHNAWLKNVHLINAHNNWIKIFEGMFNECILLEEIKLPKTIKTINSIAFRRTAIHNLSLPIDYLGPNVFEECKQLVSCDFSEGNIKNILPGTFKKTSMIKEVKLSEFACTVISRKAFFRYKDPRLYKIFKNSPFITLV